MMIVHGGFAEILQLFSSINFLHKTFMKLVGDCAFISLVSCVFGDISQINDLFPLTIQFNK